MMHGAVQQHEARRPARPQGTPGVKAFNTTFAPPLLAGEVDGQQHDVVVADDGPKRRSRSSSRTAS
jgi:hypothetical protein